jgi:hypothetical protein
MGRRNGKGWERGEGKKKVKKKKGVTSVQMLKRSWISFLSFEKPRSPGLIHLVFSESWVLVVTLIKSTE